MPGIANELDDLADLSENTPQDEQLEELNELEEEDDDLSDLGEESDDLADMGSEESESMFEEEDEDEDEDEEDEEEQGPSITFGGYAKALAYWTKSSYSDVVWQQLQSMPTKPEKQKSDGFSNIGARLQLKMEGYLGDKARLFTAINIDFNDVPSSEANEDSKAGKLRLVESFIELYDGNSTWKAGPQIITWGYMEGFEVPTDRVNARDLSYKSTEYEDTKLPSTALQFTHTWDNSQLDLIYIPVGKSTVMPDYTDYFFPGGTENTESSTADSKYATRFSQNNGNLDWAISYVTGMDTQADITSNFARQYNRVSSPGFDFQYNVGGFLAKGSFVKYFTEDKDDDPLIKNNWSKYILGGEFLAADATFNLYVGQVLVDDFKGETSDQQTYNALLNQVREQTDFISGHITANFLTGNALSLTIFGARYWDKDHSMVQNNLKVTMKYKIANGLDFQVSPAYFDTLGSKFYDLQTEVKYSF